jgi:hypothetical protein
MKADQRTKRTPKQGEKRSTETIEERVHRHISDITSEITDDDIRSVKTALDVKRKSADKPQEENKANKKQKRSFGGNQESDDQTSQEKQTTPRDLLSEGYE